MRIPLWADRIRCAARRLPVCSLCTAFTRWRGLPWPLFASRARSGSNPVGLEHTKKILNKKKEFPFWKFLSGPTGFEPVE